MNHPATCLDAKTRECNCACGGKYHGRKSGNLTDKVEASIKNIAVGDLVIIYGDSALSGAKGFVEEIVKDPDERTGILWHHGKYSIYGFLTKDMSRHRYFGDHLGYQLEPTGAKMTVELLEEYAQTEANNLGIRRDIERVKINLGRKSGRNVN